MNLLDVILQEKWKCLIRKTRFNDSSVEQGDLLPPESGYCYQNGRWIVRGKNRITWLELSVWDEILGCPAEVVMFWAIFDSKGGFQKGVINNFGLGVDAMNSDDVNEYLREAAEDFENPSYWDIIQANPSDPIPVFRRTHFNLGTVVETPGVLALLKKTGEDADTFVHRHANRDWAGLSESNRQNNEKAVQTGSKITSAYQAKNNQQLLVVTDQEVAPGLRQATTVMLPSED